MIHCKFCSSQKIINEGNIINGQYSKKFNNDYKIMHCNSCESKFIFPTPASTVLAHIYSNPDYSAWDVNKNKSENIRYLNFLNYFQIIKKYQSQGKILDCGCATGYFLDVAKENNMDCYGIEISNIPYSIASQKFPHKIFAKHIEETDFDNASFNLITMFDFIEHVNDSNSTLKRAHALLKQGGYLAITTPDTKSFSMSLLKKTHSNYILEHLNLFNNKNIHNYLKIFGFETIKIMPAKKILSLSYAESVFKVNRNFFYYPLKIINHLLPKKISHYPIKLSFGDMLIIATKK